MRMHAQWLCLWTGLLVARTAVAATSTTGGLVATAETALQRSTEYIQTLATEGGYLWSYSPDLAHRAGEVAATPTQIWVQAPGTPAMGDAFLRAYAVTKDVRYLAAARAAALALVRGQLESGGWQSLIEFDSEQRARFAYRADSAGRGSRSRNNVSTYDDDTTQHALRFLMAFVEAAEASPHAESDAPIREALDYGLKKLLEAQYPNGAWPQRWDGSPHDPAQHPVKRASLPTDYPRQHSGGGYAHFYTFNDNAQRDLILTLLEAHRRTGRDEYRAAAVRGADFVLLAQLPEPQPIWAQQYNFNMEPAWARAFEPPAISAGESAGILRLLVDLYVELGDDKYLQPIAPALAWFERSAIGDGRWARYYELHTNRPIYGDRDGQIHYTLEEISEERRRGYAWQGSFDLAAVRTYHQQVMRTGRDRWLEQRQAQRQSATLTPVQRAERASALAPRVRAAVDALDPQGRWISSNIRFPGSTSSEAIQTRVFIANAGLLCEYLELMRR